MSTIKVETSFDWKCVQEELVRSFNEQCPIGGAVKYRWLHDERDLETTTRSEAYLHDGKAVVKLTGLGGLCDLTRVEIVLEPPPEPETPEEWQRAVDLAHFALMLERVRPLGLASGFPQINVERCEALLSRGKERGFEPGANGRWFV